MRLRAGRRRDKREDEGGATTESPLARRFSFGGVAAAAFPSSSSEPPPSSSPSLPRAFADIDLVSSLKPALSAARKSSDNLFELVKNEREKVAQSIRSAAAAAAASPFAPVSLDDFGGEAWRNATTSLAFFGGGKAAVERKTTGRKNKPTMNNTSKTPTTTNRRQASTAAASPLSQQPAQFGLDVFSALNESVLMRGSGSNSGSRQLKSQVRRRRKRRRRVLSLDVPFFFSTSGGAASLERRGRDSGRFAASTHENSPSQAIKPKHRPSSSTPPARPPRPRCSAPLAPRHCASRRRPTPSRATGRRSARRSRARRRARPRRSSKLLPPQPQRIILPLLRPASRGRRLR